MTTEYDRELDRIEDLIDEMCRIKDDCVMDALEIGEPVLDHKAYYFKCTSAMTHLYRKLIPKVRIRFDGC